MLIVTKRFYPGNKSGGPQTSLLTLCKFIVKEKKIKPYVITYDRDVGEKQPYKIVDSSLVSLEFANVSYLSEKNKIRVIVRLIKGFWNNEKIIVNSFFDPLFGVLLPILFSFFYKRKIYCYVRGELQNNSLSFKKQKKMLYMYLFGRLFAKKCVFIFSDKNELMDSKESVHFEINNYQIVPNIPQSLDSVSCDMPKNIGKLYLVYLGRIDNDKNLKFLLTVLKSIKRSVVLDIYGPIRNEKYWDSCLEIIGALKESASINYMGILERNGLSRIAGKYHFLVNPSFSENYGHSIAESLGSGLPAIVTTGTPWVKLEDHELGFTLNFDEENWIKLLSDFDTNNYHISYERRKVNVNFKNYPLIKESTILNEKFIKNL